MCTHNNVILKEYSAIFHYKVMHTLQVYIAAVQSVLQLVNMTVLLLRSCGLPININHCYIASDFNVFACA